MPWTVADTNVAASQLGNYLATLDSQGLEAQVHLAGPLGRTQAGQIVYEATYLVLARAAKGPGRGGECPPLPAATAPAPEPEPEPAKEAPPDWLAGLEPGLRDALAAAGFVSVAGLAAAWPDQVAAVEGLTVQDVLALQGLLASYAAGEAPPEPREQPEAPRAKRAIPRAPAASVRVQPPQPVNGAGLIMLPGMEGAKMVPPGYTRARSELPPELQDAAVLDGKDNVHHQSAIILPRRALDAEKDGVEFREG